MIQINNLVLFHLVGVNGQIAFRDVLAPVRFFKPFPRQYSRPSGTPRVYHISCPEAHSSYLSPADVICRAQTVLGSDSVVFPRDWLGKAKSSDVASSIPECSSDLSELGLAHIKLERNNNFNTCLFFRMPESLHFYSRCPSGERPQLLS
jgi:hypothetical protein